MASLCEDDVLHWAAGMNNERMNLEYAYALAYLHQRTLVLPPHVNHDARMGAARLEVMQESVYRAVVLRLVSAAAGVLQLRGYAQGLGCANI